MRFRSRMGHGIADHIAECLLDELGVRPYQRQLIGQTHFDDLHGTPAAGGAGGPLRQLAQVGPVAPHFQRAGIDARHGEKIAHHIVEALGLVLDLIQQLLAGTRLELVGNSSRLVADPRMEASGVRKSCEIEANSVLRTRSASAALRTDTISRASEARSNAAAVCSASVSSSARASGSRLLPLSSRPRPMTQRSARGLEGQKDPWDRRQGRRIGSGRLVALERPPRRGHRGRVESILGRPRGTQFQLAVLLEQDERRPCEARVDRGHRGLRDLVEAGDAGSLRVNS